jgi:hypothetical protein
VPGPRLCQAALLAALLLLPCAEGAAPPVDGFSPRVQAEVRALIGQLAEVSHSDIGYSATYSGSVFLPLDPNADQGHIGTLILGVTGPARSDVLRRLVQLGPYAMPELVAHLGDRRKTGIQVRGGMPWFREEFDYNARTDPPPKFAAKKGRDDLWESSYTTDALCVGDLCFVAIGQIVNRSFNAMRYQPSMIVVVSSPVNSPLLRENVTKTWAGLTPARHKAALVADFLKPDSENRRNGACRRLAYYYPEALDAIVPPLIARPTYCVWSTERFVRNRLYAETDSRKRKQLFDGYIKREGEPARAGILEQLFDDLDWLEAVEEKRASARTPPYGTRPREVLIELYGKPKTVRSTARPRFKESLSNADKYHFINDALLDDDGPAIDHAVRELLVKGNEDWLSTACIRRLIGRGYDREIEAWCREALARAKLPINKSAWYREQAEGFLARLGWTRLHVAAERGNAERLRRLL